MRIHYLRHVPFEGVAYIGEWASHRGHRIGGTALFAGEAFPELSTFDFLVVMGGPMSVGDTLQYPWLESEKRFIEQVIRSKKHVIGICLGAQLIAEVLGAKVYKNEFKEIGWHPVLRSESAHLSAIGDVFPPNFQAFHWHGDTFDLPAGAVHIAQSEACLHQAFTFDETTLGLQFHLEASRQSIDMLIDHCGDELIPGQYIQSAKTIGQQSMFLSASNEIMKSILDHMEHRCLVDEKTG